jgi:serine/threonine protein phosphatase PrpC
MTIKVASAWRKGKMHQRCQDKVNVCTGKLSNLYHETNEYFEESDFGLAVVCDGAGSKPRSELGAYTVAKSVEGFFRHKYRWNSYDELNLEEIKIELLQYIIQEILNVASKDDAISDYACTLIFVLYIRKSKRYIYGHIGDGGIVELADGSLRIISGPENGEYKNQTYFITDRNSAHHFYLGTGINESEHLGFLLCTDGIADSLFKYSATTQKISPVCHTLCQWLMDADTSEEVAAVRYAYKENLQKYFASRSKDDLSLAVMTVSNQEE